MTKAALLDSISPGYKALASALTAAGLDPAKIAAGELKLADHIAAQAKAAAPDVAAAVEAATAEMNQRCATLTQAVDSARAERGLYIAALEKVGVTVKASDEKTGLTAADIEQAVRNRASIMAQEQLAKHNLKDPLPLAPAADPAKTKAEIDPALKGLARVTAAFKAQREAATV